MELPLQKVSDVSPAIDSCRIAQTTDLCEVVVEILDVEAQNAWSGNLLAFDYLPFPEEAEQVSNRWPNRMKRSGSWNAARANGQMLVEELLGMIIPDLVQRDSNKCEPVTKMLCGLCVGVDRVDRVAHSAKSAGETAQIYAEQAPCHPGLHPLRMEYGI